MPNAIPADHHTVTTDTGTTIGHTWTGPWQHPALPEGGHTVWFARSVHDAPGDPFLHDFTTQAQAEEFLRARAIIASRAEDEARLLAHPEHRETGYREILVHLEGSDDQPLPALFTYDTGPRFSPEIADIVIAVINRGYQANHESALAYRDGTTITVIEPNGYAYPTYRPEQYQPGDDGRYALLPDGAWYPTDGEDESPTEEDMTRRRRFAHQFLARTRRRR